MNATGLADGDHEASIFITNNDPFNSLIEVPVLLHVGEVDLAYLNVEPNTLNLGSEGNTVRAAIQLPLPYDPADIVLETVCVFGGQLCALPFPFEYTDENFDGIMELVVKFDRAAFQALAPEGDDVPVTVTGEVRDTTWFTGTDTIRAIRPQVMNPNGADYLVAGNVVNVTWRAPLTLPADSYTVWLSRDGGASWEPVASGVTGTSYNWTVTGPATSRARIRVFALDSQGVMGYDDSDADFSIAAALLPPNTVDSLVLRLNGSDVVLDWKRPDADLDHGPVDFYRVMRSTSAQGPFSEIGTTTTESFADALVNTEADAMVFFKVIAVNAAGGTD
jgi:hypothetical protein